TVLKTRSFAAMMMGVRPSDLNVGSDGSITVEQEVEGVEITSIGFDGNGNIAITIDAELSSPSAASAFYEVNIPDTVSVNCKVYRKETLAESEWTLVSETRVAVGGGECVIDAGAAASGGQSGFYKVVVEK
ncbi:MAG: hypothetical protein IKD42_02095, partial [Kiritimatiellae bacterium]|nr:hypothetical protein [Kiritimatiellia bacterium]